MKKLNQFKSLLLKVFFVALLAPSASAEVQLDRETGAGVISDEDFVALKEAADSHGVDLADLEFFAVITFDYQIAMIHSERAEIKLMLTPEPLQLSDLVEAEILSDRVDLIGFAGILDEPGFLTGPAGERVNAAGMGDSEGEFFLSKLTPWESGKVLLRAWDEDGQTIWSAEINIPGPEFNEAPDPAGKVPLKLRGAGMLGGDLESLEPFAMAGTGTHLGRWTAAGTLQFVPFSAWLLEAESLEAIFTSANGDQLHAVLSEDFGGFVHPETGMGLAVVEFSGGTGRFQNAEGWSIVRIQLLADDAFVTSLEGMISRPSKN
jgi:hypothetical protein